MENHLKQDCPECIVKCIDCGINIKKEEYENTDNRINRCKVNNSIDIILNLRIQSVGDRKSQYQRQEVRCINGNDIK